MMINKRLIAMVPEVKPFIFKKVVASWVSLLAGIVLWFTVAKTLDCVSCRRGMHRDPLFPYSFVGRIHPPGGSLCQGKTSTGHL